MQETFGFGEIEICSNCREYKGIQYDEENDRYYCIFCE